MRQTHDTRRENRKGEQAMKKLNLTVVDRIANIKDILPQKSNMIKMVLSKSILDKTELTSDEIARHGIMMEPSPVDGKFQLKYQTEPPAIEVELNDAEVDLLKEGVKALDTTNAISLQNIKLCQEIMAL